LSSAKSRGESRPIRRIDDVKHHHVSRAQPLYCPRAASSAVSLKSGAVSTVSISMIIGRQPLVEKSPTWQ
jgi:hypothetical protein